MKILMALAVGTVLLLGQASHATCECTGCDTCTLGDCTCDSCECD